MNSHAVDGACAFAWRNYLLLHSDIDENDGVRAALCRYIADVCDAGAEDFEVLQIAAVAYLKKLDEFHEDGFARVAADRILAECLESRGTHLDTSRQVTPQE